MQELISNAGCDGWVDMSGIPVTDECLCEEHARSSDDVPRFGDYTDRTGTIIFDPTGQRILAVGWHED